jgi:hypothetical protein
MSSSSSSSSALLTAKGIDAETHIQLLHSATNKVNSIQPPIETEQLHQAILEHVQQDLHRVCTPADITQLINKAKKASSQIRSQEANDKTIQHQIQLVEAEIKESSMTRQQAHMKRQEHAHLFEAGKRIKEHHHLPLTQAQHAFAVAFNQLVDRSNEHKKRMREQDKTERENAKKMKNDEQKQKREQDKKEKTEKKQKEKEEREKAIEAGKENLRKSNTSLASMMKAKNDDERKQQKDEIARRLNVLGMAERVLARIENILQVPTQSNRQIEEVQEEKGDEEEEEKYFV